MIRIRTVVGLLLLGALSGCGSNLLLPTAGDDLEITFSDLPTIPAEQGTLEIWVFGGTDTVSVGRPPPGALRYAFRAPLDAPEGVIVTLEPPADPDPGPAAAVLLHGDFRGMVAELGIEGVVTDGRPLQSDPGSHSLFTTVNNPTDGYPSSENAGMWLFTLRPSQNVHQTREVRLTPLRAGWVYEGWIVWQGPPPVWISYGKFRPDELGLLSSRDDTGTGPFAGAEDFRNAGTEDVPGEEWVTDEIAAQLGIALPGGFDLPLELDAVDPSGAALWHHVISIEPASDLAEGPLAGSPFALRPYENPIGEGWPGDPRLIVLATPTPTARVAPAGVG